MAYGDKLTRLAGIYHLRWTLPPDLAGLTGKKVVQRTLKTRDRREACARAFQMEKDLRQQWTTGTAGRWEYRTAQELAEGPIADLVQRLEEVKAAATPAAEVAGLGLAAPVSVRLSELPALDEKRSGLRNAKKTPDQMRKWRNPRRAAVAQMIEITGDKALSDLTRDDARRLRRHFEEDIKAGRILADTANKRVGFIRKMLTEYWQGQDRDTPDIFAGFRLAGGPREAVRRLEMPRDWIEAVIHTPGPLDGLNQQARDLVLLVEGSGCRRSEIAGAGPGSIFLDEPIPFIAVEMDGRDIKNRHSIRNVPLCGPYLEAMKRNPTGFPRYRGKDNLSAVVNKYLRENKLMPTDSRGGKYSFYSLRHSFETRMKEAGVDIDDRAMMMGHSRKAQTGRETYGDFLDNRKRLAILARMEMRGAAKMLAGLEQIAPLAVQPSR